MVRFRFLRTKLSVFYAGLFVAALGLLAVAGQIMLKRYAESSARAELATSATTYDRIWEFRTDALTGQADVLARDFGFRSALASGDIPTVASAAANLNSRVHAASTLVITPDGLVTGRGPEWLQRRAVDLPYLFPSGRGDVVVSHNQEAFQLVVRPILAPAEIGWIVFAVHLDRSEMKALEGMSAVKLTAEIMTRSGSSGWRLGSARPSETAGLRMLAGVKGFTPVRIPLGGEDVFALAKPLPTADASDQAMIVIRYPVAAAMAPFGPLQFSLLLAGLLGLAAVVVASWRLARSIANPISELDQAAQALAEGARVDVPVRGHDEIGRLARRFNEMAGQIFERENRIVHMAFNDALTNLPNRAYFRQQLEANLRTVLKNGSCLAVLTLDLDGFKNVNDTLGHPVGDELLVQFSARLIEQIDNAFVARLGGDEFAIILTDHADADLCMRLARRIIELAQDAFLINGQQALIGTSIGIALAPSDGTNADTLLKNADLALYRAKQDGRGVFRFFEPALNTEAQHRRQVEIDLREALQMGQFELHFQPIYSASSQQVVCFEALLRWNHPMRGLVGPNHFVRIAEESGLMLRIGEWVIQEACRRASDWPEDVRVAVNVSPMQFRNPALNSVILRALAGGGLAPHRLELEITESVFLDDTSDTIAMLHRLRDLGVRISLDDFGTGYSSLQYLRNFPFDKIKIDKSFVDDIESDEGAAAIVQAIVDLANALGMETTAEGVEREDQLECLRSKGCSSLQGFLMSRPLPGVQAAELVRPTLPFAMIA